MGWPPGVTDGLTLPCYYCERVPAVDYHVTDECWAEVLPKGEAPDQARLGVVCIECFAALANRPILGELVEVQVVQGGETLVMRAEQLVSHTR